MTEGSVLQFHPVADIFPLLEGDAFAALVDDIRSNGLRDPVLLHADGSIIDGRNRYRACVDAGVTPSFRTWNGQGSLVALVLSTNLHRRHLNESQRAMAGARAKPLFEKEARERQLAALKQNAPLQEVQPAETVVPAADVSPIPAAQPDPKESVTPAADSLGDVRAATSTVPANLPEREQTRSRFEAASLVNVSPRTVEHASKVVTQGAPELQRAVEHGEVAVSTASVIAELPKPEQAELVARGEKEILAKAKEIRAQKAEERREKRMEALAKCVPTSLDSVTGPFPIVLADPPWRYEYTPSESRAIENQYPTMTLEEICALKVAELAGKDSMLFLWATSPKLAEALRVIEAWGFEYKTPMVWIKNQPGMGYYARQQHELLLIAKRGDVPVPAPEDRPCSVIDWRREEHSAKPVLVHEVIERMYPKLAKVELFARHQRQGWACWGNQVPVVAA